jgi:ketosteroid isomerase-like protein
MTNTEKILSHHIDCFRRGDLAGLLSDYSKDSILEVPQAQLCGLEKLHKVFSRMLEEFSKGKMKFEIQRTSISGEYAYIFWTAQTKDNNYHAGSDTFIIQNNKIVYQTFTAHITPRNKNTFTV